LTAEAAWRNIYMRVKEDFTEGMIDKTALGYVAHYRSPLPWANFTYPQLGESWLGN